MSKFKNIANIAQIAILADFPAPSCAAAGAFASHLPSNVCAIDAERTLFCSTICNVFLTPGHSSVCTSPMSFSTTRATVCLPFSIMPIASSRQPNWANAFALLLLPPLPPTSQPFTPVLPPLVPNPLPLSSSFPAPSPIPSLLPPASCLINSTLPIPPLLPTFAGASAQFFMNVGTLSLLMVSFGQSFFVVVLFDCSRSSTCAVSSSGVSCASGSDK